MAGNASTVARLRFEFLGDLKGYRESLKTAKMEGEAAADSIGARMKDAFAKSWKATGGVDRFGIASEMTRLNVGQRALAAMKVGVQGVGSAMKNIPTAAFNAGLNLAHKTLNGIKGAIGQIAKGFAIGIGFTGVQMLGRALADLVGVIPNLINRGREFGQVVADVSQVTGITGERASEFVGILKLMDAPMQNIVQLLAQFQRNVQTPAVKKAFAEIGISITDMNGATKDAITLLYESREAIERLGVSTVTVGNIQRAFGRGGIKVFDDLIRMPKDAFQQLQQQVVDSGLIMSAAQAQLAENMKWSGRQIELSLTGIGVALYEALGPGINAFLSALSDWINQNRDAIAGFFTDVAAAIMGFVAALLGADLAVRGFADSLDSTIKTLSPLQADLEANANSINELDANWDGLVDSEQDATKAAGSNAAAIASQTKAIDRQIKALDALDARQEKVYRNALRRLGDELDAQLAVLDAEERRRALADRDRQLTEDLREAREALNDAEIALAAAQAGDRGKVDAEEVASQMQAVVEAQRAIEEAQRAISDEAIDRASDARRAEIEAVKEYIGAIDDIINNALTQTSALNTLKSEAQRLRDEQASARAAGDTTRVADIQAELDALKAAEVRVTQEIANEKKKTELETLKESLQAQTSAVRAASKTQKQIVLDDLWKRREELRKAQEEERKQVAETEKRYRMFGEVVGGDDETSLPARFKAAAAAGAEMAEKLKDALEGVLTAVQNVGTALGGIFDGVQEAWEGLPEVLRNLIGADIGNWLATPVIGPIESGIQSGFMSIAEQFQKQFVDRTGEKPTDRQVQQFLSQLGVPGLDAKAIAKILEEMRRRGLVTEAPRGSGGNVYAAGGLAGGRGPERALLGEQGAEWVINAPALKALANLNRAPAQAIAAVAGGGGVGGQPAIVRLEIGGRPLLDYMDENLVYRRRI